VVVELFKTDIRESAQNNTNFRKVIYTGKNSQLVLMSIPMGEDIGEEVHKNIDQIFFFVDGEGEAIVGGENQNIGECDVVFVPAGTKHNFRNIGGKDLKLFTIYCPPAHSDGTIHKTKEEALKEEY